MRYQQLRFMNGSPLYGFETVECAMYGCSKLAKKITEESEENYINKLTKEKEK